MEFFKRKQEEVIDKSICDGYYFRNTRKVELNKEERSNTITFIERSCKMDYIKFDQRIFTLNATNVDGYHYLVLIFNDNKSTNEQLLYYKCIVGDPLLFVRGLVAQETQGIVIKASTIGYSNILHILDSQWNSSVKKIREAVLKDQVKFLYDYAEQIALENNSRSLSLNT